MICISLGNMSFEECGKHIHNEGFVELRLDMLRLSSGQLEELVAQQGEKIITCRQGYYTDNERFDMLLLAIEKGVQYIDLELEMPDRMKKEIISQARSKNCRVIISHHDYSATPGAGELRNLVNECKAAGADIVKLACQVIEPSDNLRLLSLLDRNDQLIVIGMGSLGTITRIAGPLLGSPFTYAAPGEERETASGQLTKESMLVIYDLIGASSG